MRRASSSAGRHSAPSWMLPIMPFADVFLEEAEGLDFLLPRDLCRDFHICPVLEQKSCHRHIVDHNGAKQRCLLMN